MATVTSGTWNGTIITPTYGGLGGNFSASTGALSINAGVVSAGTLSIANGGTGQTTAALARGSSGLNIDEMTTNGDSAYTILSTDRTVATSATLTAARIWTLPAASSINAGQQICVVDKQGGVTATNTITITRAGSDTINGATTYTLNTAYQGVCLISDGTSKWSTGATAGAITGSGTTNYVARWTPNGTTLGTGTLYDNGTQVGIGTASPGTTLQIYNNGGASPQSYMARISQIASNGSGTDDNTLIDFYHNNGANSREWKMGTGSNTLFGSPDSFGFYDVFGSQALLVMNTIGVAIGTTGTANALTVFHAGGASPTTAVAAFRQTSTTGAGTDGNGFIDLGYTNGANNRDWLVGTGSNTYCGSPDYFCIKDTSQSTASLVINTSGKIGIGVTSPAALLNLGGAISIPSWSTTGVNFATNAATYTDTSTAAAGTVTIRAVNSFGIPTLASSNAITVTNAANLYIAGAPVASGSTTITNANALYVAGGNSYFGGNVGIGTTSPGTALSISQTNGYSAGHGILELLSGAGSYGAGLTLNATGGTGGRNYFIASTTSSDAVGAGKLQIYDVIAAQARMIIDNSGSVGIGSSSPITNLDLSQTTGAIALPTGNSSNRPTLTALANGEIRYNTSIPGVEAYINGTWSTLQSIGSTSGTLGVSNGGTGDTTLTAHGILVGEGTAAVNITSAGTAGQLLIGQGATMDPAFQTITGDVTVGSSGAATVGSIGGKAVSLGSSFTTSGAYGLTLTTTGTTNVTLPTTGTLVNTAVTTLSSLVSIGTVTSGTWNGTTIAIANGGTGQTTAALARGSSGLNIDEMTSNGDSAYTILSTDRTVATSATLTAARIWTLPAASSINAGQQICVVDKQGGVTATNTITITRAGSDTINGATTYTLNTAYQGVCLISDGTSKWSTGATAGAITGSGTTNYVARWTPNGTTLGTGEIIDIGTAVGIGTASPTKLLHLSGGSEQIDAVSTAGSITALTLNNPNTNGTTSEVRMEFQEGNATYQYITGKYNTASPYLAFGNNTAETMRITSSGFVGIGTTSVTSLLQTYDSAAKTSSYTSALVDAFDTSSTSSINKIGMDIESTGSWTGTNTGLVVNATGGGTNNYAATFSGGNVGIGITTPAEKLSVSGGNISVADGSGGGFIYGYDANHGIYFREGGLDNINYYDFGGVLAGGVGHKFYTGGLKASQSLRMQISNDGIYAAVPLSIGTTVGGSNLLINGNAAIGYSTTTIAPTNGLVVSGSTGLGTVSPIEKLSVGGNISVSDGSGGGFIYGNDTAHGIYFREGGTNNTDYYEYGGNLSTGAGHKFYTGGLKASETLRMQIANDGIYMSGNVGIGSSSPITNLDLSQTTGAIALPTGNSSNRPTLTALANGEIRYNTSIPGVEAYINGTWSTLQSIGSTSGTLGVSNGGTGDTTLTAHGILVGEGTAAVNITSAGTAGQLLIGQGATMDPAFQTITGDVTVGSSGAATVGSIGGKAVSLGSSFTTSGAYGLTLTTTGTTNVTLPTTGTLVNTAVTTLSSLVSIGTVTSGTWNGTTIAIANGGTGQTTAALARGSSGLNIDEMTTNGDSAYTILSTDRTVATSATLTAARIWTLPAASSINAGQQICVVDKQGGVTSTNTITITIAGSDTINGATTYTLNTAYQGVCLISDGTSKWSTGATAGAITGSGTTNYVARWTPNGTTLGTGTLYDNGTQVGIGIAAPAAQLHLAGNQSAAAWTTSGIGIRQDGETYTDITSVGTVSSNYVDVINSPTLAASSATTYTQASTLYVSAPIAGSNVTINSPLALLVNGRSRFTGFTNFGDGGVAAPTSIVQIRSGGDALSNASWTTTGVQFSTFPGETLTDSSGSGTIATRTANSFGGVTFAASGTETITNAATLYVASAPSAGTNVTITNPMALYVAAGTSYFGGNVGIGTTSPGTALSISQLNGYGAGHGIMELVSTGTTTNGAGLSINSTAATGGHNYFLSSTTAADSTGVGKFQIFDINTSAARLVIDGSGNVGIGTATPNASFVVQGSGTGIVNIGQLNGSSTFSGISFTENNSAAVSNSNYSLLGDGASTYLNAPSAAIYFRTNNNTNMIMTNAGNIGIGTTSPGSTLQVNGNTAIGYAVYTAASTNGLAVSGSVGIGSSSPITNLDLSQDTGAIALPIGNSSNRPTSGALANGEIRYNTSIPGVEAYINGVWSTLQSVGTTSGTLGVSNGGTGDTTLTAHGILVGEGTAAINITSAGTAGQLLIGQGATLDPAFQTITGDVTVGSSGAATVGSIGGKAVSLGSSFTTSGAYSLTLTTTGTTNVTLPTSGTLVNTAVTTLSSLTSIGTVTSGTWNGTIITPTYGGLGGNFSASTGALSINAGVVSAGTLSIANGGTGQTTAALARGSSGLNIDEMTTNGDSAYTILSTDRTVATSATLTAARIWTLPAASSINAGQQICVVDKQGGVTATNTITITRAGSDTINGATTYTLNTAYQGVCLISDGTSKWSTGATAGAITGSGTTNYVARWTPNGTTLGTGTLYDNGTQVGIGTTSPAQGLEVSTNILADGNLYIGSSTSGSTRIVQTTTGSGAGELQFYYLTASRLGMGRDLIAGSQAGIGFAAANGTTLANFVGTDANSNLGFYRGSTSNEYMTVGAGVIGISSSSPITNLDLSQTTGAIALPTGNSSNRPTLTALANGEIRYNTSIPGVEAYINGTWSTLQAIGTTSGTLGVANGGTGATTLTGYVYGNGTSAMTASTTIPETALSALSANQVLGSLTAVAPSGLTMPSCSTTSSALMWTSGTGFTCNTAIAAPAGTLSGTTLNSTVVNSSLTSVGTVLTGTWTASVIGAQYGGTGLATLTSNVIYKGNGTGALTTSALTDNGTIVTSSENIDATTKGFVTEITNNSGGTIVNKLAKLTSGQALTTIVGDTDGIIGIVIGGAGTSGTAQIAVSGQASCVFDGSTTAGDYVVNSTTVAGDCHDTGSTTRPTTSQTIGRALTANVGAGTYALALGLAPSAGSAGAITGTGTANYVAKFTGTTAIGTGTLYDSGTAVAIGSTSPQVALDVTGAIYSRGVSGSSTTIDWSQGNSQSTTSSCGAFTFSNMQNGGTYTLAVLGGTSGTCAFTETSPSTLTFKYPPNHGATTTSTATIYSFTVMGSYVFISWTPGYSYP